MASLETSDGMEHEEEILNESVDEKFQSRGYTTKQVKMAIGIASDQNIRVETTLVFLTEEKIKKGLGSNHPQLSQKELKRRQNEEVEIDEMKMNNFKKSNILINLKE